MGTNYIAGWIVLLLSSSVIVSCSQSVEKQLPAINLYAYS